jgi:hypothetical protein
VINPLAPYVILIRQQDLLDEARSRQVARRAQLANPEVPAWRRSLAGGARRLSDVFASAARTIDPAVDCADAAAA